MYRKLKKKKKNNNKNDEADITEIGYQAHLTADTITSSHRNNIQLI